jgi:hypothetical protein
MRSLCLGAAATVVLAAAAPAPGALPAPNPFAQPSTLPFQAPPFDKIKDTDYQPALEEGMRQQITEIQAIANNPARPTFENTIVTMEKSGRLLDRVQLAFSGVVVAKTNDTLYNVQTAELTQLAPHNIALFFIFTFFLISFFFFFLMIRRPPRSTRRRKPRSSIRNRGSCSKSTTCSLYTQAQS